MILISTETQDDYADLVSETPVAGLLSRSALSVDEIKKLMVAVG
jgi:hypothetical protein